MRKVYHILIATAIVIAISLTLYAHPGRTDASGGHYDRKTGVYHYHNSGRTLPVASEPTYTPPVPEQPAPSERPTSPQQRRAVPVTKKYWRVALNNKLFKGKLEEYVLFKRADINEVNLPKGLEPEEYTSVARLDISTDTSVVEVDRVSKYEEGLQKVLKYAGASNKKPVLALYIDGDKNGYEQYQEAEKLCKEKGVTLLLANCHVRVNDLITLVSTANNDTTKSEGVSESESEGAVAP